MCRHDPALGNLMANNAKDKNKTTVSFLLIYCKQNT